MQVNDVVVVSLCRTPIAKFQSTLKDFKARDLAVLAGKAAIERAGIGADLVDEIVMGEVYSGMQGSLPARQVAMRIGLPHRSGAVTVNQNCASGMRAMEIACQNIMLGKTEVGLVVGVESMTNTPYLLPKARMGYRMGDDVLVDSMLHDALVDELVPGHMGLTSENIAKKYNITREECDELALLSHQRAAKAQSEGKFDEEIVPVEIKTRKGVTLFEKDEHIDYNVSLESLAKLRPAFVKEGVTTAGNASGINDGAAAAVIMSAQKAKELGLKPLMKLVNICSEGVDPLYMGIGPAYVIPKCLKQANLKFEDVDYWEINEAFAAQWLGVKRIMDNEMNMPIPMENVNRNGSGISLGHPIGCTALRIIVSLYYEMKRSGDKIGCASLCVGGGPAMASIWEMME